MTSICVTGHRDLKFPNKIRVEIKYLLKYFLATHNELTCVSPLAPGADTLFAEEALSLGIPLRVLLPQSLEDYRHEFSVKDRKVLDALINKSSEIQILNIVPASIKDTAPNYLEMGKRMVDEADIVVAVWNGLPADGSGGTGDIVNYAAQKNKITYTIDAEKSTDSFHSSIPSVFEQKDKEAIKYKKRFYFFWQSGILLGLIAAFCIISLFFSLSPEIKLAEAAVEILAILFSLLFLGLLAPKYKLRFLKSRKETEIIRNIEWLQKAGLPIDEKKINPVLKNTMVQLAKNTNSNSVQLNMEKNRSLSWILAQQQADYQESFRLARFEKKIKKINFFLFYIKALFIVIAFLKFTYEISEYFHWGFADIFHPYFKPLALSMLLLPPVYAALEGIKYFNDWKKNVLISKSIISELQDAKSRILQCKEHDQLIKEAQNISKILLRENDDWLIRFEEKEVESKI